MRRSLVIITKDVALRYDHRRTQTISPYSRLKIELLARQLGEQGVLQPGGFTKTAHISFRPTSSIFSRLESLKLKTRCEQVKFCESHRFKKWVRGPASLAFDATLDHCAFYPGAIAGAHKRELEEYSTSKGTIRLQPDNPVPKTLALKLVRTQFEK